MPDDQTPARTKEQIEGDARLVGWLPQEEYRGAPEKWKGAEEFLQLSDSQLPMARATNRRLTETNAELTRRLKAQDTAIQGLQESLAGLQEFHSVETKRKVKEAREKLLGELRAARTAGDVDAEVEIVDALTKANDQEGGEKKTAAAPPPAAGPTPEWKAWESDNPKFSTDKKWRGVCIGIAEEMRMDAQWNHLQGRAFFDEVTRQTDAWFAQRPGAPARVDKTEPGGGGAGGTGGSGAGRTKSYNQLPPDAKAQCEKDSKKFVGKSEQFKTIDKWREYFAKVYWENEE